jgi:hypothetical protein
VLTAESRVFVRLVSAVGQPIARKPVWYATAIAALEVARFASAFDGHAAFAVGVQISARSARARNHSADNGADVLAASIQFPAWT